ncbi:acyl carrier protein [Nocardia colli]|uniref:Acyl carrier protein n=1 Tax=Nocardia colli TaxID=2545717 RepID=A0A5N0EIB3_9NOCA|nr:acyl carrier protein [Nocardia colli]KAA8888570.1 acyl carrier protein [Nocardia colli]
MPDVEKAVHDNFRKVIASNNAQGELDPDLDMVDDYGLTSLNKVLFLTAVCDDTGISLANFTEENVAAMRTLRDVTAELSRHAESAV